MATTARTKIGRLRVFQETTFAADVSGSVGSMGDLRIMGGTIPANVDPEMLADERTVQSIHEHPPDVLGFRKADGMQLRGYIPGSGQTLNAAATPTKTTLLKVLERIVGGYQVAAGSAYASGASATGATVTSTQGSRFPVGTIAAIESASASGLFAMRKISSQATDALGWSIATGLGSSAFTIATGCRVLNSFMIYPTNNPNSNGLHLSFLTESEDRYQNWWFTGCNASAFGIEWPLGKDIGWSATMMAARRWLDSEVGTPLGTGGSIGASTYDDGSRCVATAGSIWFTPFAGTALAAPAIYDLQINLGIKWQSDDAFNGTEGRSGYSFIPDQATLTIVTDFNRAYETARDAGTYYQLLAQAGQTAGNMVAFEAPRIQIVSAKPMDKGGLRRHQLTCKLLQDTVGSTELAVAPWRMAWA